MKRKLGVLSVALIGLVSLTSCNNRYINDHRIIFWTNVWGDSEKTFMDGVVNTYNNTLESSATSGTYYQVNYEQSGDYPDIAETIAQTIATPSQLPNMAVVYPDYIYNYIDEGLLVDLKPLMNDSEIGFSSTDNEDYIKSFIEEGGSYAEGTYTLPYAKSTEALYYNSKVLKENNLIPEGEFNFRNMIDGAKTLMALPEYHDTYYNADGSLKSKGLVAPIGFNSTSNLYITMSQMLGIPYAGSGTTKQECVLFNNDKAKAMVKMLKTWYDQGLFTTAEIMTQIAGSSQYIETPFYNGQMFYCIDSTRGYTYFDGVETDKETEETTNFFNDTKVSKVPSIDASILESADYSTGGDKATKTCDISQGGSIVFFDQGEEENKEAFKFYKELTTTSNAANMSIALGSIPLRNSSYDEEAITEITAKKDIDFSTNPDLSTRQDYLLANIYEIYDAYGESDEFYMTPVNAFSSATRTAVETILLNVLTSNRTDIDTLIKEEFTKAYDAI